MEALAERLDLQALVAGLQAATPLVEDGEGPQDDTDTARETEGGAFDTPRLFRVLMG